MNIKALLIAIAFWVFVFAGFVFEPVKQAWIVFGLVVGIGGLVLIVYQIIDNSGD